MSQISKNYHLDSCIILCHLESRCTLRVLGGVPVFRNDALSQMNKQANEVVFKVHEKFQFITQNTTSEYGYTPPTH